MTTTEAPAIDAIFKDYALKREELAAIARHEHELSVARYNAENELATLKRQIRDWEEVQIEAAGGGTGQ